MAISRYRDSYQERFPAIQEAIKRVFKFIRLRHIRNFCHFLSPASLRLLWPLLYQYSALPDNASATSQPLSTHFHSTTYFDGIRGWMALNVASFHYFTKVYPSMHYGYGFDDSNYNLLQLPVVKIIAYNGTLLIFFVISGMALSYKPIMLIRSQQQSKLLQTLSSLTLRRACRLFLPSIISLLVSFILQKCDLLRLRKPGAPKVTSGEGIGDLINYLKEFLTISDWSDVTPFYNTYLWTIPTEFRCSMVVFVTIMGLGTSRMSVRLAVEAIIAIQASWYGRWDLLPFMCGVIITELIHESAARKVLLASMDRGETSNSDSFWSQLFDIMTCTSPRHSKIGKTFLYSTLFLGMWLGSFPYKEGCQTPGFIWTCYIDRHEPEEERYRHVTGYGAVLICASISFLPELQRMIFTTRLMRYLGKIAYSMYLSHFFVVYGFGLPMVAKLWNRWGREAPLRGNDVAVVFYLPYIFVVFWVADLFEKLVDAPCVKLARWMERHCSKMENAATHT